MDFASQMNQVLKRRHDDDSCRMAIFVNMIKTIGRSKPEGTGDDDEEKDYPPMMIEVLLAQTAHKRSSIWWSVVATEHYDHYNYIAHILNKKGQYFDPPKMIFRIDFQ